VENEVISIYFRVIAEQFSNNNSERRHREILEFLSPVNHVVYHEAARKLQQEGTGRWFLDGESFQRWLSAEKSFLWVHGIGKYGI
jgi:hypothetical protein